MVVGEAGVAFTDEADEVIAFVPHKHVYYVQPQPADN